MKTSTSWIWCSLLFLLYHCYNSFHWCNVLVFVLAPNSQCVVALINKLGLDIEMVNAYGKTREAEFLKMNPCHVCPTLEIDDNNAIWESSTILRYIATTSGEAGLKYYPEDPVLRAKIDMAMDWRQTTWYTLLPPIGYIVFGYNMGEDDKAKANFKLMEEEVFPVFKDCFLKETKFIFSDTPTIADLSIGATIRFLAVRPKFWAKVPQEIKDYEQRVKEHFSENKDQFAIFEGMVADFKGEGSETEP